MNYRHAYHAGNHADVLKHIVLVRVLERLKKKDKPFRVIDAHAGIGVYDLQGIEAGKTGEWEGGIGRLSQPFDPEVEALIAPYRQAIAAVNQVPGRFAYPGSPEIAARLMRAGDTLLANELHPEDHDLLGRHFRSDKRVKVSKQDAEACIGSSLPPPERRGLILIDPPYEAPDDAERAVRMVAQGLARFTQGIFLVWYPLKAGDTAKTVVDGISALGVPATLQVELRVREAFKGGGLAGSGLILVNTPWRLDAELRRIAPPLAERLGLGDWGQATVKWLAPPA